MSGAFLHPFVKRPSNVFLVVCTPMPLPPAYLLQGRAGSAEPPAEGPSPRWGTGGPPIGRMIAFRALPCVPAIQGADQSDGYLAKEAAKICLP